MKVKLFGGINAEAQNALMQAFQDCAEDEETDIYDWIESTTKTSMVVFLTDKLRELGFNIVKIK